MLDRELLELQDEVGSYFPNSVQIVGDRLLVAEEHLNHVSEFLFSPLVHLKSLAGCAVRSPRDVFPFVHRAMLCDKSISYVKFYSPNDAISVDGRVYVADTDNHRVVELFSGKVVAQLVGFNSPVGVRVVGRCTQ